MSGVTITQRVPLVEVNLTGSEVAPNLISRPITINTGGTQGPPGPSGPSSAGVPPVPFSYGDADGVVFTPSEAGTLTTIRLVITTAFNGTGAAIELGTLADSDAAMAATLIDPATVGEYEHTADLHLSAGTAIRIDLTPGVGASQGAGIIYFTFLPD